MERVLAQRYTAGVITAFCRNNQVDPAALPQLVGNVLATWLQLDLPVETPVPSFPVVKAKRGRPAQNRVAAHSRQPRSVAVADVAATSESASVPELNTHPTEQPKPVPAQASQPQPDLVLKPKAMPEQLPASTAPTEEALPDRDSPEMKRHTVESVFGKSRPKRQNDAASAQGSLLGTESGALPTKRIPFSQQSLRRLRS
jgi:hypothetical protein